MNVPPCKKNGVACTKRSKTCHSHCKEYLDFKAENARIAEERRRQMRDKTNIIEISSKNKRR